MAPKTPVFYAGQRAVDGSVSEQDLLNEAQRRRFLAVAKHADELLCNVEAILTASETKAAFPKYRPDVSPHQARLMRSHIARFRSHLLRAIAALGVRYEGPETSATHAIRVALAFVRVAIQEMAPERLHGYGRLPERAAAEIRGLCMELDGLLKSIEQNLVLGDAADLQARLDRLQRTVKEAEILRLLDQVINQHDLAEFRSSLIHLLEKVESRQFEIAVFGRVSSGKSSLLNHILGMNVLPVGVNPITAVPTRLIYDAQEHLIVSFADRQVRRCPLSDLPLYASEERNPGNQLGVTRLEVRLPSPRLRDGLVLVDTPGLGALAAAGATETLAYLPKCDLGILLISAVNPINDEDLDTIYSLAQAGIPAMVLLSKADLLGAEDLSKALAYTAQKISTHLNLKVAVYPVSTVAAHEHLLEEWFQNQLAPLYERYRELVEESVRRKAGALRDAVLGALRSKLGGRPGAASDESLHLDAVERTLREAAASIEETRQYCLSATDRIRSQGPEAIRKAAASIAQTWATGGFREPVGEAAVSRVIQEVAAEASSPISGRLRSLAEKLESAVKLAAETLGWEVSEDALIGCLREMPRFEVALPRIALRPPWFLSFNKFAQPWIERTIRKSAAAEIDASFVQYGRALQDWAQRILAALQSEFETRVDASRAQLARLTASTALSPEERARIESDIARLQELGGPTAPDAATSPELGVSPGQGCDMEASTSIQRG